MVKASTLPCSSTAQLSQEHFVVENGNSLSQLQHSSAKAVYSDAVNIKVKYATQTAVIAAQHILPSCHSLATSVTQLLMPFLHQIPSNIAVAQKKRASRSPLFPYSKSPVDLEVEVYAETHCGHVRFVLHHITDQSDVAAEIVINCNTVATASSIVFDTEVYCCSRTN